MSTANKLAKILDTKSRLKEAITNKGVVVNTDVFAEYPSKVLAITSGGGGGGGDGKAPTLTILASFIIGATYVDCHSDTELIQNLSLSNVYSVDSNNRMQSLVRTDSLNFRINFDALQDGDLIEFQLLPSAFVNMNGTSNKISKAITEIVDITELFDIISGATYILNSSSFIDISTYTVPVTVDTWNKRATNMTITADGAITIGNLVLYVNARDESVKDICYATYKLSEDVTVQKIRWHGRAHYSYDYTEYAFELYLLSTGAAMLYLSNQPTDYFYGTFSYAGISYTLNSQNSIVSFYSANYSDKEFDIVNDVVDITRKLNEMPDVYTFDDLLNSRYYMQADLWNTRIDDGVHITNITLPWSYNNTDYTTLHVSGNSFIGIGTNVEHIKLNRRDAALLNVFKQSGKINIDGSILDFIKVRWHGYSAHSATDASYLLVWDLYLFSNGDAMIQLINKPTDSWNGTFSFFDTAYTISASGDSISFYRQNIEGTSWTAVTGLYNVALSLNLIS